MSDMGRVPAAEVGLGLDRLPGLTRRGKAYLLLLPSLVFLVLFTYFPIIEVLWASLFHKRFGQAAAGFVGFDNYVRVLQDQALQRALINNTIYALGTV